MTDEWCTQSFRVLQTYILQFMTSVISAASCVIYMYIRQTARDVHLISNNYVGFYLQQSGKISYACDRARKISCQCFYSKYLVNAFMAVLIIKSGQNLTSSTFYRISMFQVLPWRFNFCFCDHQNLIQLTGKYFHTNVDNSRC